MEMRGTRLAEYLWAGLQEARFTLRTNAFMIVAFSAFILLYAPLGVYNLLHSEALAMLPEEARLRVALPVITMNSILLSMLLGVIISSTIEQEKVGQVLEYLVAFSPYTVGEYLLIKLVSALVLGVLIIVPYTILVYLVLETSIAAGLGFLLRLLFSIMASAASFTLFFVQLMLMLSPRYTGVLKLLVIMLVFITLSLLMKNAGPGGDALGVSGSLSAISGPLNALSLGVLLVSIVLYLAYGDKIMERAVR